MIRLIAFDADDTLWHSETLYLMTQDKFKELLSPYQAGEIIDQKLYETEMRNIRLFGYGVKGFTLSMIETAIELTEGRITGREIQTIIDLARTMLNAPIRLLDRVEETLEQLSHSYELMLLTKGDLLDQESKIARSGLADYFDHIEVVSRKESETYRELLARYGIDPANFLMVGNSLRSDVLPVVAIGGQAVHIPYQITWTHETVERPDRSDYFELEDIGLLPDLLKQIQDNHL